MYPLTESQRGKMNRFDYIQILEKHLLPLIKEEFNCRGYWFQDDNAPVHTARNGFQ